jgi:hypothetical protein
MKYEIYLVELQHTSQNRSHITPGFLWDTGSIMSTYKLSTCKQITRTLLKLFMSGQ